MKREMWDSETTDNPEDCQDINLLERNVLSQ